MQQQEDSSTRNPKLSIMTTDLNPNTLTDLKAPETLDTTNWTLQNCEQTQQPDPKLLLSYNET